MRNFLVVLSAGLVFLAAKNAMNVAANNADTADGEGTQNNGFFDFGSVANEVQNMIKGLRMSPDGLAQLQQREALRLSVYRDQAGKPTIGYGHLIRAYEDFSNGITEQQAVDMLAADVASAENAVAALVTVPLSVSQFDSLVSFAFNAGVSAFTNSTLLRVLNGGDYDGAMQQIGRWVYVTQGGVKVVSAGLANRRNSEMMQCKGGIQTQGVLKGVGLKDRVRLDIQDRAGLHSYFDEALVGRHRRHRFFVGNKPAAIIHSRLKVLLSAPEQGKQERVAIAGQEVEVTSDSQFGHLDESLDPAFPGQQSLDIGFDVFQIGLDELDQRGRFRVVLGQSSSPFKF